MLLRDTSAQFVSNISVTDEFIRVRCFDENNTAIYTNVFSFVPTKTDVEERCAEIVKKYSYYCLLQHVTCEI
jgi:hypothetical protein